MDFKGLSDRDLQDKLEKSVLIEKFMESVEWKLIDETCKRTADQAKRELIHTNPDDTTKIVKLQQVARLYGDALPNLVKYFVDAGDIAIRQVNKK